MAVELEALARDEVSAGEARQLIWSTLSSEDKEGACAAYSALCRWTWRITVERRLDAELPAWHRLLLDVAGRLTSRAEEEGTGEPGAGLSMGAAAERVRGLADILRLSIDAAELVDMDEFMSRAHVMDVLKVLAAEPESYLQRDKIRKQTGLGQANLSRLLTLLAVKGLLERKSVSKSAAFKITPQGLRLCGPATRPSLDTPKRRADRKELVRFKGGAIPSGPLEILAYGDNTAFGWVLPNGAKVRAVEDPRPAVVFVSAKMPERELDTRIVSAWQIAASEI